MIPVLITVHCIVDFRKKSDCSDAQEAFRQIINRYRKRSQENMHKVCEDGASISVIFHIVKIFQIVCGKFSLRC